MPKVIVTTREGAENVVDAAAGTTLMEAIRDKGIDELLALCGGCCSCATCHVYIDEPKFAAQLSPISHEESELLDGTTHRKENSRLSCQVRLKDELDGMKVTIAPED